MNVELDLLEVGDRAALELTSTHRDAFICSRCSLMVWPDFPDPCLSVLPGVRYACCGHGCDGYIAFGNGLIIRFDRCTVETTDVSPDRGAWSSAKVGPVKGPGTPTPRVSETETP